MKTHPRDLRIQDFSYELPEDRIPLFPPSQRGGSKLLIYREGTIQHDAFDALPETLPASSLLVFNQSKVIPARLWMQRPTGARIEIFLLEPADTDHLTALQAAGGGRWTCLVGGAKKWKDQEFLTATLPSGFQLHAYKEGRSEEYFTIRFEWEGGASFADIIEEIGKIPLPPYLKRETSKEDEERYQTVYARLSGSVAAPTAGLHLTNDCLANLHQQGHALAYLTLHVGAGTFKPVSAASMEEHHMHTEHFVLSTELIDQVLASLDRPIIPVGTTSMRTLESLYWLGLQCIEQSIAAFHVSQWQPYSAESKVTTREALQALRLRLEALQIESCEATTGILIAPGYTFRVCNGLITNFHQPQSTLLLLVAALIGDDWRSVYDHAMSHGFHFLSYGDSSLLLPK
jgi:S-adenosylmethionine:tRNA ribosyltransferase-isomerase